MQLVHSSTPFFLPFAFVAMASAWPVHSNCQGLIFEETNRDMPTSL
jgi:hypothetical protein